MSKVAKLADAKALEGAVLAGDAVDIVVSVPLEAFGRAREYLEALIADSPDYVSEEWDAADLRTLCAVFWTTFECLPIGPYEHVRLVNRRDIDLSNGQYVGKFAVELLAANPSRLKWATVEELETLADHIHGETARRTRERAAV